MPAKRSKKSDFQNSFLLACHSRPFDEFIECMKLAEHTLRHRLGKDVIDVRDYEMYNFCGDRRGDKVRIFIQAPQKSIEVHINQTKQDKLLIRTRYENRYSQKQIVCGTVDKALNVMAGIIEDAFPPEIINSMMRLEQKAELQA